MIALAKLLSTPRGVAVYFLAWLIAYAIGFTLLHAILPTQTFQLFLRGCGLPV